MKNLMLFITFEFIRSTDNFYNVVIVFPRKDIRLILNEFTRN